MGKGWSESIHPDDVAQCILQYNQAVDRRQRFKIEYRVRRFDGQYCWVADYGAPRHDLGGRFCGYIGCRIDITEQKISEQCLQELSSELIHSQEDERKRIARELHDEYSQQLTLVGFELAKLNNVANADPLVQQVVVAVEARIRDLSKAMNARAHQLHSLYLEIIELGAAMRRLCEDFSSEHSVAVDFVQNGTPPEMPANVRLSLFRVLEEALQNIARDGGARRCRVELNLEQQKLALRIVDSRTGLDTAGTIRRAGFTAIRERLREIQGDLQVRSSPASGTWLEIRVPIPIHQTRRPA
jgi:signal transduction histidine kinase